MRGASKIARPDLQLLRGGGGGGWFVSAHRFLHERADLGLVGCGQLLARRRRPHGAFVEVRAVVEAEHGVPLLELPALRKKQTTLPSLAYAGIPYRSSARGPVRWLLTISWSRSPMERSCADIAASEARTALSLLGRLRSRARAFIAAFSSFVNPLDFWFFLRVLLLVVVLTCSFRSFDDLREAVEPSQPGADALEGVGTCAPADTADLLRGDEVHLFEQPDVLLHSGQRHAEGLGELADRRAADAEPFDTARRVGSARAAKARSTVGEY